MPQASATLRDKMQDYFGDPISDHGPYQFLILNGYTEQRGMLHPPPYREMTEKEGDCIDFLIEEWDYDFESGKQ